MNKHARVADENDLQFVSAVFSHTCQTHVSVKHLIELICHRLLLYDGETVHRLSRVIYR